MSRVGPDAPGSSVAVVGAGVIGLSVAWQLARSGRKVTLFDQSAAGSEASWAGAGMLAPGGEFETDSPLTHLALASRRQYRSFVEEIRAFSERSIDFQEAGALELAYSPDESVHLEAKAARQELLGIRSKRVDVREAATFWPRVRKEGLTGARFYPEDAVVNPRDLTYALKLGCQRLGVDIREHYAVTALSVLGDGVGVHTASGTLSAGIAVVSAGAWSSRIPVEGVPALPGTKPIKGHLLGYPQPHQTCTTIVRYGHTYLLQRDNGLLVVGASTEDVGFDRGVETAVSDRLAREAGYVFPHLAETTPSEVWVGFRPGGDLQLGSWHSARLMLAYGHYRNGILLAPATAEKITKLISASS